MPPTARNRQQRRAKGDDSQGMTIEYDGRKYVVRESDLTPRDVAALRRETGFAGWLGLATEVARGFDLDVLAALIWLARRKDGDIVPYESVLDEMSYDIEPNLIVDDQRTSKSPAVVEGEVASPEA